MWHIELSAHWRIGPDREQLQDASTLLALLAAVQAGGSLAQAARELGLSYRHAWGLVGQAEASLGQALMLRGRGQGSQLTDAGQRLVWADARVTARLQPLLASLASEVEGDLGRSQRKDRAVPRLHASHGFAVARLHEHMTARQIAVELRYRNSLEAVAALAQGDCELAGFHVPLGEFEKAAAQRFRPWLHEGSHRLVQLAVRTQGLFLAPGNPLKMAGIPDLRRRGMRFVNRPEGSGTRMLTDLLLQRHGIRTREVAGYDNTELTHAAVAAYVASGMADAGIGVQTAAERFGLAFIPLLRERYFFAIPSDGEYLRMLRPILSALQSASFRSQVASLPGYEAADTGRMLSISEAFGD